MLIHFEKWELVMLSEIFFLRLENIRRSVEMSTPAGNARFVPITLPR
jgi:hypothetical protein